MGDEDRQLKYINVGMEFTNKVTKKILENLDEDEQSEQLEIMKTVMKDYIKMEHEYNVSKKVLSKLKKGLEVENADMDRDIDADYRSELVKEMENDKLTEERLISDQRFKQLENIILGSGGHNTTDDDLIMTESTQTFIDPWTRKPITDDPVTNRKCGHTYERATVMKFLEKYSKVKKKLKCPIVGCTNDNITKSDLYTDQKIKRMIQAQNS